MRKTDKNITLTTHKTQNKTTKTNNIKQKLTTKNSYNNTRDEKGSALKIGCQPSLVTETPITHNTNKRTKQEKKKESTQKQLNIKTTTDQLQKNTKKSSII